MNRDWIEEQFIAAKVRVGVGKAVINLLETWDKMKLTSEQKKDAVEIFSKLALGHALVQDNSDEVWIDAMPGQIKVGDIVRVKADAYEGRLGEIHNGRRCKIVAARSGDIILNSIDGRDPIIDGAHHSPYKVQKLVK
jgi:hypothetical protein